MSLPLHVQDWFCRWHPVLPPLTCYEQQKGLWKCLIGTQRTHGVIITSLWRQMLHLCITHLTVIHCVQLCHKKIHFWWFVFQTKSINDSSMSYYSVTFTRMIVEKYIYIYIYIYGVWLWTLGSEVSVYQILRTYRDNRMAWQWAETLVEIRVVLADIRGTTN